MLGIIICSAFEFLSKNAHIMKYGFENNNYFRTVER